MFPVQMTHYEKEKPDVRSKRNKFMKALFKETFTKIQYAK